MAGKEGKADQKKKQIGEENPFVREMREEACKARAFDETRTQKLLERDGAQADEGRGKRMAMKNGDRGERRAEKQKINQNG